MEKKAKSFVKKVVNIIKRPEMRVLPGQLAFFFVLSLIPIIALVGTLASGLSVSIEEITNNIENVFPKELATALLTFVNGEGMNFNIAVFFISAFILASNGTHSMIITSNEIYKIKDSGVVKRRLKAVLMTFVLVGILFFLLVVPVFGGSFFRIYKEYSNNQVLVDFLYQLYNLLKYPLSLVVVYISIKSLYTLAPDKKIRTKTTTKGAIFTTISWVVVTYIYSFYVGKFVKYDIFYGSISNILILLLWIYILSYIFVLGMAINASNTREEDIERTMKTLINK